MSEYSWDNDKSNPMRIQIFHHGKPVIHFFLGEAMELAGRTAVMRHVHECDRTPWLKEWHAGQRIIDILKA